MTGWPYTGTIRMKITLQKVRDGITAVLLGKTIDQVEKEALEVALKTAVEDYLVSNPDWEPPPKVISVKDSKQKATRIMKSLGAGAGFTPHVVDEEELQQAIKAARAFQKADPERYSHIIAAK